MARTKFLMGAVVLVVSLALFRGEAQAVPGFASRNGLACSACHIAFPKLNSFGRVFKENGFMVTQGDPADMDEISDKLSINKSPSLSGLVKLRPIDRKRKDHTRMRVFHEAELFLSGHASQKLSYFVEFEAEDEPYEGVNDSTGNAIDEFGNFHVSLAHGKVGYHASKAINLLLGWGPVFWTDPYGVINNMQRLTMNNRTALSSGQTQSVDLDASHQFIMLYGRPGEGGNFFYQLGVAGGQSDAEQHNQHTYLASLNYDFPMGLTIGGFGWVGNAKYQSNTGFNRYGFDFQYEKESFVVNGAYMLSKDDPSDDNKSWYIEGLWKRSGENGNALVPNIRYESTEMNDGASKQDDLALNLTYYFRENAKAFLEYWTVTSIKPNATKSNRIIGQVEIGIK